MGKIPFVEVRLLISKISAKAMAWLSSDMNQQLRPVLPVMDLPVRPVKVDMEIKKR